MPTVGQHLIPDIGDSALKDSAVLAQHALQEKSIQRKMILAILCEKCRLQMSKMTYQLESNHSPLPGVTASVWHRLIKFSLPLKL